MGCAEMDDSYMVQTVRASLNTTKRIKEQLDKIEFVIQIGDISYAMGYSSLVITTTLDLEESVAFLTELRFQMPTPASLA
eukprot:Em0006g912a